MIRDCNFKNPVILPEKVTDPINILINILIDTRLNEIVLLTLIISENAIKFVEKKEKVILDSCKSKDFSFSKFKKAFLKSQKLKY